MIRARPMAALEKWLREGVWWRLPPGEPLRAGASLERSAQGHRLTEVICTPANVDPA